jgi:predicted DNA binding CopG/RHH family protein
MHLQGWERGVRMREPKSGDLGAIRQFPREYRSEEEFKEALRTGKFPWTEFQRYFEWRKGELKDYQIALRISKTDVMKLKALARMQGKKYQTYIGEILKGEIHWQEDRLADPGSMG